MTTIPPARAAALLAIHAERERQDGLHGFDPTRPTGFGRWWAPLLDRALHWLYERAKRRKRLTWAHTLVEEVGEVLSARTPAAAVKELRQVAAVCVKVEEALVAAGLASPPVRPHVAWTLVEMPAPGDCYVLTLAPRQPLTPTQEERLRSLVLSPGSLIISDGNASPLESFRAYAATLPREARTAADCQALLGAMELARLMGADAEALAHVENPAELGATIARLTRAAPPTGGMQ